VASSDSEVWCDAGFLGGGIVSYGMAGTNYSVEYTGTTTNNALGVAIDISGNRVWYEDSTDVEQTNLSGTAGVDVGGINNGSFLWWDATGARLFYGGSGIRYWNGNDLDNEQYLTPLTNTMNQTTNIGFLMKPQFWTGLAVVFVTVGVAGPAAGFISANVALLASLFGIISQLLGFGAAQRLSSRAAAMAIKFENVLLRQSMSPVSVDQTLDELSL
jgi:hypothetical protein